MLRAELSQDEWAAIRKLAIDKRTPIQRLIADALRRSPVTKQAFKREQTAK